MVRKKEINGKEIFIQNGCYGNHLQPLEILFYSIDANISCSLTKQDWTVT